MGFTIVTDTCCNLSQKLINTCNVKQIPLSYFLDGELYKMEDLGSEAKAYQEFYQALREGKTASTSMADRISIHQVLQAELEAGNDILYIGFSSALSGTFNNVYSVSEELRDAYPKNKVILVDSLAASAGQGLLVYLACQLRDKGKSLEVCAAELEELKDHIGAWFTVNDLNYLAKGGRISKTSAQIGSVLNIKPILHVDEEGRLIVRSKVRSRKKSLQFLLDVFDKTAVRPIDADHIFIGHGDCEEEAKEFARSLVERYQLTGEPHIMFIDPVIGTHTGPGIIALFFCAQHK